MSECSIHFLADGVKLALYFDRYERLTAEDESDLNWLSGHFDVRALDFQGRGSLSLTANDLQAWHDELEVLLQDGSGTLRWEAEEQGLLVELELNRSGRASLSGVVSERTGTTASLSFRADTDYSRLRELLSNIKDGSMRFPVRSTPSGA